MNKNNPHKSLRSSWRSEVFTAAKTKGIVIVNRSLGSNSSSQVVVKSGGKISSSGATNRQSYLY